MLLLYALASLVIFASAEKFQCITGTLDSSRLDYGEHSLETKNCGSKGCSINFIQSDEKNQYVFSCITCPKNTTISDCSSSTMLEYESDGTKYKSRECCCIGNECNAPFGELHRAVQGN